MNDTELLELAVKAANYSYCCYSGFKVGAAILTADGKTFLGCNIENSSFSLTNCAERTAVFKAISEGCKDFIAIAVAGSSDEDFSKPCIPCGACLQVLNEFCGSDMKVILADRAYSLGEFLPYTFKL